MQVLEKCDIEKAAVKELDKGYHPTWHSIVGWEFCS